MQTYRQLFAIAEFRVLFAATSLSVAAGSVASLALGTLTYAQTGSPILSAFVMFGGPLVRLASSWFLLGVADLWRPRTALMVAVGVTAGGNALQAIPHLSIWPRIVLLLVPWVLLSATSGSMAALICDVVPEGAFVFARATSNVAVGVMQIVGFSLGGLLLLQFTPAELFAGAAAVNLLVVLLCRVGLGDHPPRAQGRAVRRSRAVNRLLLGSPVLRPVYLALWVPNGLVVGCEALIVPYAGARAGFLFSAAAVGMLVGDVGMGRFVPARLRDRFVEPARLLLAAPYILFLLQPSLGPAFALAVVASVGYCASLPLQERLVTWTAPDIRGQVLGLYSVGMSSMQGVGALLAGSLGALLGGDAHAAGQGICAVAVVSLVVTIWLVPGLRRSRQGQPVHVVSLGPHEADPGGSEVAEPERARPSEVGGGQR